MVIAEKNQCASAVGVCEVFSGRQLQLNRAETCVVVNFWAHALQWSRHDQAGLTAY